jgi:hypothetical protein
MHSAESSHRAWKVAAVFSTFGLKVFAVAVAVAVSTTHIFRGLQSHHIRFHMDSREEAFTCKLKCKFALSVRAHVLMCMLEEDVP